MDAIEYQKMYEFENNYWWYSGLHDLVVHYVRTSAGGMQRRVFDAGCGTGRTLERIAGLGRVQGVDYSEQAVELCRSRGLGRVAVADLNNWQGEADSFDVVVSLDVICTEGIADDQKLLSEFHRILVPGGRLILNLPAFWLLRRRHDLAVSGLRRYRKKEMVRALHALGFKIERAGYRLPLLFIIILILKLFEGRKTGPAESDLKPLPGWLNSLLRLGHRLDNLLFRLCLSLPFGSSLFVVCRKES